MNSGPTNTIATRLAFQREDDEVMISAERYVQLLRTEALLQDTLTCTVSLDGRELRPLKVALTKAIRRGASNWVEVGCAFDTQGLSTITRQRATRLFDALGMTAMMKLAGVSFLWT